MRLLTARVTKYRSIEDSSVVDVERDVTCLVGKNESGKTSFLRALSLLNPIEPDQFNVDIDYPRKDWADYKHVHEKNPAVVVEAKFELDDSEVASFKEEFGPSTLKSPVFGASKNYANGTIIDVDIDEPEAIRFFLEHVKLDSASAREEALKHVSTLAKTQVALTAHADAAVKALAPLLAKRFPKSVSHTALDWVWARAPQFVYFSEYQFMPGVASIPYLIDKKNQKTLTIGETTLLRLIAKAGLTLDELRDEKNFERHVANLEAAAIAITREAFKFWTQNKELRVQFRTSAPIDNDAKLNRGPLVRVRIENARHGVTVPFDERSRGFVWFFSFLSYFSELEKTARTDLIVLLDEPGLSLHATAQADLLRFIDERLAPSSQVMYSTHSPFMVNPRELRRVRTVQDMDDVGTVVSRDVFKNDEATIFPLQAALGFEISQTLFIGPNSLLVEGPSEVLYLPLISEELRRNGRVGLDPRWTLTPVGGIDKATSFISLFGSQKINIALIMDYASHQKRLAEDLRKKLGEQHVVALHEITGAPEADIEDLFEADDYLLLVNEAYRRSLRSDINASSIKPGTRIVPRVEHYFEAQHINGGRFSHGDVAVFYARSARDLRSLSPATLKKFEALFQRVNQLLPATHR